MTIALEDDFGLLVLQTVAAPAAPVATARLEKAEDDAGTDRLIVTLTSWSTTPSDPTGIGVALGGRLGYTILPVVAADHEIGLGIAYPEGIPEQINIRIAAIYDVSSEVVHSLPLLLTPTTGAAPVFSLTRTPELLVLGSNEVGTAVQHVPPETSLIWDSAVATTEKDGGTGTWVEHDDTQADVTELPDLVGERLRDKWVLSLAGHSDITVFSNEVGPIVAATPEKPATLTQANLLVQPSFLRPEGQGEWFVSRIRPVTANGITITNTAEFRWTKSQLASPGEEQIEKFDVISLSPFEIEPTMDLEASRFDDPAELATQNSARFDFSCEDLDSNTRVNRWRVQWRPATGSGPWSDFTSFGLTVPIPTVAPVAVGAIGDVAYVEDTGAQTVEAADAFSGPFLEYSLDGTPPAGVTIDSLTGDIAIANTDPLAETAITVRATNNFGSATQTFNLTISAAVVAPSVIGSITDKSYTQNTGNQTVATAAQFAGTTPFTFSLVSPPAGVTINSSTGVVTISTTGLLSAATVTVRATNSAGTADLSFAVTVTAATVAPSKNGTIADRTYNVGSGSQTVEADPFFNGTRPFTFALVAPIPAGVSISSTTGRITIATAAELAQSAVTVQASNGAGSETQAFNVTVVASAILVDEWRPVFMRHQVQRDAPPSQPEVFSTCVMGGEGFQWWEGFAERRAADPDLIIWGQDMGNLRGSPNGGRTWISWPNNGLEAIGVSSCYIDPADPDTWYVHGSSKYDAEPVNDNVYMTRNRGVNFTPVQNVPELQGRERYSARLIDGFPISGGSATTRKIKTLVQRQRASLGAPLLGLNLYEIVNGVSTSKGTLAIATFGRCSQLVQHPTTDGTVFLLCEHGVFRSTNWGTATPSFSRPWAEFGANFVACRMWIDPADPDRMIVSGYGSAALRGVYWTVNGGAAWNRENSGLECGNMAVGAAKANGDRVVYLHLRTGSTARRAIFKGDDTGFGTWTTPTPEFLSGITGSHYRQLSGDAVTAGVFQHGDFLPHPTNPNEAICCGQYHFWRTTDGGVTFQDWNDGNGGINLRDMCFSPQASEWGRLYGAAADVSCVEFTDNCLVGESFRCTLDDQLHSGRAITVLPNSAPVPEAARNRVICGVGNIRVGLYRKPRGSGTWTEISPDDGSNHGRAGFDPNAANWVASGADRSDDGFTTKLASIGNGYHFAGWSGQTEGRMLGFNPGSGQIAWSNNRGATGSWTLHYTTNASLSPSSPDLWLDPHNDGRIYTIERANGRNDFILLRGATGSITKVEMNLWAALAVKPNHFEPFDLAVDPYDPRWIYAILRSQGADWVWRGHWNAAFSAIEWESITRNLPRATTNCCIGVNPYTAEPFVATPNGVFVLTPPPNHRTTHNITNSVWALMPPIPTNGWNGSQTGITFPAAIADGQWSVTEVRNPDEATAQGFTGEDGHLKAVFNAGINAQPAGFQLRHQLLNTSASPTLDANTPAVEPGTTYYTNGSLAVDTVARPALSWHHLASGELRLAGIKTGPTILGLQDDGGGGGGGGGADFTVSNSTELKNRLTGNGVTRAQPGDIIDLEPGNYTLSLSGVSFGSPFVTLRSQNNNNRAQFLGGDCVQITNGGGLIFDNINFTGNDVESTKGGVQYPGGRGLRLENFSNITFIGCNFRFWLRGVEFQGGSNLKVQWCRFHQMGMDPVRAFSGVNTALFENTLWDDMRVDQDRHHESPRHPDAVQTASGTNPASRNWTIRKCKFLLGDSVMKALFLQNNKSNITFPGDAHQNFLVEDIYIEQTRTHGLYLSGWYNGTVRRVLIRKIAGGDNETPRINFGNRSQGCNLSNCVHAGPSLGSSTGWSITNLVQSASAEPDGWVMPVVGPANRP